jgi:hypothetical protein
MITCTRFPFLAISTGVYVFNFRTAKVRLFLENAKGSA